MHLISAFLDAEPAANSPVKLLPRIFMDALLDSGICHYMIVLRDPGTGHCTQWDFGPKGGDVHVDLPNCCQLSRQQQQDQRRVAGGSEHHNTTSKQQNGES